MLAKRWRHKARGTTYRLLFEGARGASSLYNAIDGMGFVVYQAEVTDIVFVRPFAEFFDGRFEPLEDQPPHIRRCR